MKIKFHCLMISKLENVKRLANYLKINTTGLSQYELALQLEKVVNDDSRIFDSSKRS